MKKELIKKGTLVLSKGTLIILNRNSYYQKGTHQKRNTRIIKRNTHIIK